MERSHGGSSTLVRYGTTGEREEHMWSLVEGAEANHGQRGRNMTGFQKARLAATTWGASNNQPGEWMVRVTMQRVVELCDANLMTVRG